MGRKIDSFSDLVTLLKTFDNMPKQRVDKCSTLYALAQGVEEGIIIEFGTYHGIGAITLWHGARVTVVTIDAYSYLVDWIGTRCGDVELSRMRSNLIASDSHPVIVISEFSDAATFLGKVPIGLLYWDAGTDSAIKDIAPFLDSIVVGGKILLHDTSETHFNSDIVGVHFERFGFGAQYEMPGKIYVSERINK